LPGGEMAVDVGAAGLRERPSPWLDGDLDRIKRGDLNRAGNFIINGCPDRFARSFASIPLAQWARGIVGSCQPP
jgi:hypothetical protein